MTLRISFIVLLLFFSSSHCLAAARTAEQQRPVTVAVLDFGEGEAGRRVADRVAALLKEAGASGVTKVAPVDRELVRAAARGAGYGGSLNMTRGEARDLGAAIGCDFFITGDAETLRRSSSAAPVYYEAYTSVFVVSSRTGRLVLWDRPASEAATPEEAERMLAPELTARTRERYHTRIVRAFEQEERERLAPAAGEDGVEYVDLSSEEGAGAVKDLREPAPYRRLRPAYPDTAERAGAEATVDASVEIGADGEVARVEIVRWAGFGLDDAVLATVRQLHFRPATRDGVPVPVRVLLRYNFRRPAKGK